MPSPARDELSGTLRSAAETTTASTSSIESRLIYTFSITSGYPRTTGKWTSAVSPSGARQKSSQTVATMDRHAYVPAVTMAIAVIGAKKRTWLEICFVPLVPMSSSSIWNCSICGWHVDQNQSNGYAPPLPGPPPNAYNPHYQPNYGPPPGQQQWAQSHPNSFQGQPGQYQQPGYGQQQGYNPGR
ncbi:unnamed protein product [Rhizoctonia solani]|nr:unnamed protein product [Rhizoctonia solani]